MPDSLHTLCTSSLSETTGTSDTSDTLIQVIQTPLEVHRYSFQYTRIKRKKLLLPCPNRAAVRIVYFYLQKYILHRSFFCRLLTSVISCNRFHGSKRVEKYEHPVAACAHSSLCARRLSCLSCVPFGAPYFCAAAFSPG